MAKTMFDYINSSTELIEENLKKRIALTETMVNEYIKGPYHNITIVASGSSNNAAQNAKLQLYHHLNLFTQSIALRQMKWL